MLKQILLALCLISQAWAAEVRLSWNANTEPDLAGYRIHYGTASGSYTNHVDVGNVTTCTVPGLADGVRYYFAATAYDNEVPSLESGYSNEVNWQSGEPPVFIGATNIRASKLQAGSQQQMAVAITGTPAAWASGNITVPADATAVYIMWSAWRSGGVSVSAATLGGVSRSAISQLAATGDKPGTGIAVWYNPSTGSQALSVTFSASPTEGPSIFWWATKGGDLSAWRAVDHEAQEGSTATSGSVSSTTTDLVMAIGMSYDRDPGTPSGWTAQADTYVSGEYARLAKVNSPGASTTSYTVVNPYYSICTIVSIPEASSGASAVPANRGNVGMMLGMSNAMWLDNDFLKPTGGN